MGIFSKFLKPKQAQPATALITGQSSFTPWSGNAYSNDIFRSAVDSIARNVAKLKGVHVIKTDAGRRDGAPSLDRLLQIRPNPFMSAYDMLYRLTTHFYLHNNAFAYLQKDNNGNLTGIFPMRPAGVEFSTDAGGTLYGKFMFNDGNSYTLPYSDVIHLRRHFNQDDLLGDQNTAIAPALELAHAQSQGITKSIEAAATLRGLLKFTQILNPESLKAERDRFMTEYLTMDNNGGVAALDSKAEYIPLKNQPVAIDAEQLKAVKEKIYGYLGVTEAIVTSDYSEDQWSAFYESVVEPIAVQLSLEFTAKVFTAREQAFGNEIIFEANRLQYASAKTKVELIKELMPLQLLTVNQGLEILNLPSVPDGDKRLQTLNVVDADKATQYQLGGNDSGRSGMEQ
jgi:HK97 family phage portal protein